MVENEERLVYSPEEARHLIGCSRSVIYETLKQNLIPHFKLGRKYIIPKHGFHRWLEQVGSSSKIHGLESNSVNQLRQHLGI